MVEQSVTTLEYVKSVLGITGSYHDTALQYYIDEVKEYISAAGVKSAVVESSLAYGVIARGVADLWNYGSGNASLSPYFMQRVCQLAYASAPAPTPEQTEEEGGEDV